jgi:hypothetical protein
MLTLSIIFTFILFGLLPGFFLSLFIFQDNKTLQLTDKTIIGALLSPLLLVSISSIENILGIPQHAPILALNILLILGIGIGWYFTSHKTLHIQNKPEAYASPLITTLSRWIPAFFLAILFARVFPATLILTPITADPIAHAEWLRILTTTGFVTTDQWYPQGLEYFLNYFTTFTSITTPKAVLLFTNYFAALFPVAIFYLILLTSTFASHKKLIFAFCAFIIASLTPFPKELFYTAGKNSFVFALAMTPMVLVLAFSLTTRLQALLLAALAFAIFVIHFPTSTFVYLLLASILLPKLFTRAAPRFSIHIPSLHNILIFGATTVIFIATFAIHIIPLYQHHPPSEDRSMEQAATTITQPFSFLSTNLWASQTNVFEYKPCFTAHFLTTANICKIIHIDKDTFTLNIFWLFVCGLCLYAFKRNDPIVTRTLTGFVTGLVLIYVALLFLNKVPGFFLYAEYVMFFTFLFVILTAWLLTSLADFFETKYPQTSLKILIIFLGVIFLIGNAETIKTYFDRQSRISTRDEDVQAFDFIATKLPQDHKKILVELYNVDNKIIAGADSGIYIPAYTGRDIEVSWLHFSQDRSFVIYNLAQNLIHNPDDIASLDALFCDYGIGYLFHGSSNQRKSNIIPTDNTADYTLLYDHGAKLYKINNRACSP